MDIKGESKMSFCETCIHEKNGRELSESEARIHRDNYPDHKIISVDNETTEESQ